MTNTTQAASIADRICRSVAELPDRNSPEGWPEAMIVTHDELNSIVTEALALSHAPAASFQSRVQPWMRACFGDVIAGDREERNHRFLEEALELVQSCGCTAHEAQQLVDYVYGRPQGEPAQEVGGVMVTLAALCLANGLTMHEAAEVELARIWTKVGDIRAKQAAKPKHSPLPQHVTAPAAPTVEQAHDLGAKGADPTEPERLLFEAWMRGHCWALSASWGGKSYRSDAEHSGDVDPWAASTRRIWAAWRDRAALGATPAAPAPEQNEDTQLLDWLEKITQVSAQGFSNCKPALFTVMPAWKHDEPHASLRDAIRAARKAQGGER